MHILLGIIPADAGSTRKSWFEMPIIEDHPRGCGEHAVHRPVLSGHLGSSPRMRGARQSDELGSALGGIIPADAGSTRS